MQVSVTIQAKKRASERSKKRDSLKCFGGDIAILLRAGGKTRWREQVPGSLCGFGSGYENDENSAPLPDQAFVFFSFRANRSQELMDTAIGELSSEVVLWASERIDFSEIKSTHW